MAPLPAMNKNNSAVKRIMQEARELANDPCTDYSAAPLEDDIFEWHCTLRGPDGTEFEGGLYHFRILLPAEYPFRPPSIMVLTPNGRFELNSKICISFTDYHEELWQPAWGVRTAILGLQGFFPLKGQAAVGIGSIEYPSPERRRLAVLSRQWVCPNCQLPNIDLLPDPSEPTSNSNLSDSHSVLAHTRGNTLIDATAEMETPAPSTLSSPASGAVSRSDQPTTENRTTSTAPQLRHTPPTNPAQSGTTQETSSNSGSAIAIRRQRSPLILDTVICVLLVLVFALIYRRIF